MEETEVFPEIENLASPSMVACVNSANIILKTLLIRQHNMNASRDRSFVTALTFLIAAPSFAALGPEPARELIVIQKSCFATRQHETEVTK